MTDNRENDHQQQGPYNPRDDNDAREHGILPPTSPNVSTAHSDNPSDGLPNVGNRGGSKRQTDIDESAHAPHNSNKSLLQRGWDWVRGKTDGDQYSKLSQETSVLFYNMSIQQSQLVVDKSFFDQWAAVFSKLEKEKYKKDREHVIIMYKQWVREQVWHSDSIVFHLFLFAGFAELFTNRAFEVDSINDMRNIEVAVIGELYKALCGEDFIYLIQETHRVNRKMLDRLSNSTLTILSKWQTSISEKDKNRWRAYVLLNVMWLVVEEFTRPRSDSGSKHIAKYLRCEPNEKIVFKDLSDLLLYQPDRLMHAIAFLISRNEQLDVIIPTLFAHLSANKIPLIQVCDEIIRAASFSSINTIKYCRNICRLQWYRENDKLQNWLQFFAKTLQLGRLSESELRERSDLWSKIFLLMFTEKCALGDIYPDLLSKYDPEGKTLQEAMLRCLEVHNNELSSELILEVAPYLLLDDHLTQIVAKKINAIGYLSKSDFELVDLVFDEKSAPEKIKVLEKMIKTSKPITILLECPRLASADISCLSNDNLKSAMRCLHRSDYPIDELRRESQYVKMQKSFPTLYLLHNLTLSEYHLNFASRQPLTKTLEQIGKHIEHCKFFEHSNTCSLFMAERISDELNSIQNIFDLITISTLPTLLCGAFRIANELKDSTGDVTNGPVILKCINRTLANYNALRAKFANIVEKISTKQITTDELKNITLKNAELQRTLQALSIDFNFQDVDNLNEDFHCVQTKSAQYDALLKWLKGQGIEVEGLPGPHSPQSTLAEQWERCDAISCATGAIFDRSVLEVLLSFLHPPSPIFDQVYHNLVETPAFSGRMSTAGVEALVKEVRAFLHGLLEQDLPMSKLSNLLDGIGAKKFEGMWNNEVKRVTEFFASLDNSSADKTESLKQILNDIRDVTLYAQNVGLIEIVLKELGIELSGMQNLSQISSNIANYKDLTLRELPEYLKAIRGVIGNIAPDTLKYFETIAQSIELVRFCRDPNFDERLVVVRGVVQGFAFDMQLLNQLLKTKTMLNPILRVLHTPGNFSVRRLCEIVRRDTSLQSDLDAKLKQITEVCGNLPTLRDMFSPLSEFRSILPTIKRARYFRVRSDETTTQLELISEHDQTYLASMIESRLQTVKVFLDDENIGADRQCLANFERCFNNAKLVRDVFQQLRIDGHPAYASPILEFGAEAEMKVEKYEEILRSKEKDLCDWKNSLTEASQKHPRLLLLSPQQISKLMLKVNALVEKPNVRRKIIYTNILPYIIMCYPECVAHDQPALLSKQIIAEAYGQATADLEQHRPVEQSYKYLLNVTGQILSNIGAVRQIEERIASFPANPMLPKMILHFDEVPWSALLLHVNHCHTILHPAQILLADENTSKASVKNFLDRALHFNHLPFIVHGVNNLLPSLRNYLSKWAAELALCRNRDNYGQIYFIFTANRGSDLFNFLDTLPPNRLSEQVFRETFKAKSILEKRFIYGFHCLHSPEHEAKTTTIKSQMNDFAEKRLRITVNEDFTPSKFISQIGQYILKNDGDALHTVLAADIAMHLDISSYAPLPKVAQFLDSFFYYGILVDPYSGLVLHTMDTIGQIGKNYDLVQKNLGHIRWKIFVELSLPGKNDNGFEHLQSSTAILERIPSVKHLMSSVVPMQSSIILNPGLNLVAKFQIASRSGNFSPDRILTQPDPEENLVLTTLEELMKTNNVAGWRFRSMFLSILADSCDFFARYFANNKASWDEVIRAGAGGTALGRSEHLAVQKILKGAGCTYELLKREALYMASIGRTDDDRENVNNSLPLLSSREYYQNINKKQIEQLKFLSFAPSDDNLRSRTPQEIFFCYQLVDTAVHESEPGTTWAELRRDLAAGLKITETDRMRRIIEQQRYILTEQFVAKLFIVHARHQTRNNLILVGDTGSGKTELLHLYALIVNADTGIIPDILKDLAEQIQNFYKSNNLFMDPAPATEYDKYRGKMKQSQTLTQQMLIDNEIYHNTTADLIVSIVEKILAIEDDPQNVELPNAVSSLHLNSLASVILEHLVKILAAFPLIIKSEFIREVETKFKSEGKKAALMLIAQPHTLRRLINDILNIRFKTIFHRILMHKGISADSLIEEVNRICVACRNHADVKMVLFIDEFNTTSVMGILKEILVDRSLQSSPLPSNLFVIAAMNPPEIAKDYLKEYNFAGGSTSRSLSTTFAVRPPHPSMNDLMFNFPSLKDADEESFVNVLVFLPSMAFVSNEERLFFKDIILKSQNYLREAKIKNVHLSIRDILRAGELFNFFRRAIFGSILIEELRIDDAPRDETLDIGSEAFSKHFWKALLMTLAMGFSFRLESGLHRDSHRWNRSNFGAMIQEILEKNTKFPKDLCFSNVNKLRNQVTVQDRALDFLFSNTDIPLGIAKTSALSENLFCIVVCVEIRMPLTICGPPGCSKTLAYTIACDNMKGPQMSTQPLYRMIGQMHRFRYQCSEMSTDMEVEGVFNNAISLQNTMSSTCSSRKQAGNCCVLLDEAGLPDETKQPLKVLHYLQDHPQVSSIVLTNKWLDPAKTNRTLQILQTEPTKEDLQALVIGCIFGKSSQDSLDRNSMAIVAALHNGYQKILNDHLFSLKFHLRDFVYFLRYLRRACLGNDHVFKLTNAILLKAISRNFNGDITPANFKTLAAFFFDSLASEFEKANLSSHELGRMPELSNHTLEPLRESLSEQLSPDENINTSAFRYICLLDPTDSEMSIKLLQSLGLRLPFVILRGSDFEEDNSLSGNTDLIVQMKNAMAEGSAIVLVSASQIYGSFYDVFNKHFTVLTHQIQSSVAAEEVTTGVSNAGHMQIAKEYYANVAVGATSKPCIVNPNFRLIIHVPISQLASMPAPFLNRFEKFQLSIRHCLQEHMTRLNMADAECKALAANTLLTSCDDFVSRLGHELHGMTVFQGLAPDETVNSLVLRAIQLGTSNEILEPLDIVHVPEANAAADDVSYVHVPRRSATSREWMLYMMRQSNFKLMQLIRPEAIFESRILSAEYMVEYFVRQNHLNIIVFLEYLIAKHAKQRDVFEHAKRWCIFTRTSSELTYLHKNQALQQALHAFVVRSISSQATTPSSMPIQITVRSLSAITSLRECLTMVDDFIEAGNFYLIVTADMSRCTHNQINILRSALDRKLKHHPHCLVFIILHITPEVAEQRQTYPALFVENWDFIYIDSLGFTDIERTIGPIKSESRKSAVKGEKIRSVIDIDARKWLAHGYGFQFTEISAAAVAEAFLPTLLDRISVVNLNILPISAKLSRQLLVHCKDVYDPIRARSNRAEALKIFFESENNLCKVLIFKFSQMWCNETDESGSILHSVIKAACLNIRKGNVVGSLALSIRNSLQYMMFSIVRIAMVNLLSNFNLEAIAVAREGPHYEIFQPFIHAAAELIQPPAISEIFEASCGGEIVAKIPCDDAIFIPLEIQLVPSLPMYDLVSKAIITHIATVQRNQCSYRRAASQLYQKLRLCIDQDRELCAVLKLLQEYPVLQNCFFEDFVRRTLKLPHIVAPWIDFVIKICRQLALSYADGDRGSMAVAIFMIKLFDDDTISNALAFMMPLQQLNPPLRIQEIDIDIDEFVFSKDMTPKEKQQLLNKYFGKITVGLLWKRFVDSVARFTANEGDENEFSSWFKGFRNLYVRLFSQREIQQSLDSKHKSYYHAMFVAFLVIRHHGLRRGVALFKNRLSDCISEKKQIDNLKDAVLLVAGLAFRPPAHSSNFEDHSEFNDNTLVMRNILEDLIQHFLNIASSSTSDIPNELERSLHSLLWLYSRPRNDDSPSGSLISLLKRQWLLTTLFSLMSNKTAKWLRSFRDVFAKIIEDDIKANGEMDPYIPYISNACLQDFESLKDEIERPLTVTKKHGVHSLESLLFELCYHARLKLTLEYGPDQPGRLSNLFGEYAEFVKGLQPLQRAERINALAFGCVILRRFSQQASTLSAEDLYKEMLPSFRDNFRELLRPRDIKTAFSRACPADGFCYVLQSICSDPHLDQLLQTDTILNYCGIPSWQRSIKIEDRKSYMFRFLQNPKEQTSALGLLAKSIRSKLAEDILAQNKDLRNLIDFIEQRLRGSPREVYNIRFVLILVCYYDYFVDKKQSIPLIIEMLKPNSRLVTALNLSPAEIKALKFAANGPLKPKQPEPRHKVMEMYSLDQGNTELPHTMFNILAVAFGTPEGSNLLYGHVFRPILGMKTFGPGSAHERRNIDCGFLADNINDLQPGNPPILGNVYRHRYCLNALYWLSLIWSLEVDEVQAVAACRSNHFINAIGQEVFNNPGIKVNSPNVKPEHLKYYIFIRGQRFLELLSHSDLQELNINATHYFTEILLEIQSACNRPAIDPAWRSSWSNANEAIASEALFQRLFQEIERTYPERRKFFAPDEVPDDLHLTLISKWQQPSQTRLLTALPSIHLFQEALGRMKLQFESNTEEHTCIEFLERFWYTRPHLAGAIAIPRLIAFFKKITEMLSFRLTLEDTQNWSVPDAIKNALRDLEPEEVIKSLLSSWEVFKADWNMIRQLIPQLEGCADAQANRAFELAIPVVNEQSLLAIFLQHANRTDEYDCIRNLLSNMIDRQNNLLLARNNCRNAGQLPELTGIPWNCEGVLYDPSEDTPGLPLEWLNNDATVTFHFIVGDLPTERQDDGNAGLTELESFILAHREYDHFDFRRIIEHVIEYYTGGRLPLQNVQSGLNMPFQYKISTKTPTSSSAFFRKQRNIVDQNSRLFGNYIGQSLRDYIEKLKWKSPIQAATKQNWKKLLRVPQNQLHACVSFLTQAAARVHNGNDSVGSEQLISSVTGGCPDILKHIADNTTLEYLYALSKFVLESLEHKAFLYHQQEYSQFEADFTPDAERILNAQRMSILEADDLNDLLRTRKHLADFLSEVTSANLADLLSQLETCSADTPLVDLPHLQHYKDASRTFAARILHVDVTVGNFTTFLRFLHCLQSDIDSKAQLLRNNNPEKIVEKYYEQIPAAFKPSEPVTGYDSNILPSVDVEHASSSNLLSYNLCEPKPLQEVVEKAQNDATKTVDRNTFPGVRGHEDLVEAAMPRAGEIEWTDEWREAFKDVDFKDRKSFIHVVKYLKIELHDPVDCNGNTLLHLALQHGYNEFAECYLEKMKTQLGDDFNARLKDALTVRNQSSVTITHLIEGLTENQRRYQWQKTMQHLAAVDESL